MEYGELLLTSLKTTYTIAPSLLRLTILNPTMKRLLVVYRKDQRLVRSYFYYILMICQIVPRNYHFESLLMTQSNMFYTSDKLYHLETVMNQELKLVFEYCIINKVSINFAKTNYMLI